ncbi:hypothetical protein [Ornithinimicrobium faecis]|uniref:Uncharacterized protein n=1 Tax=Ornithinimicrobium faecis TaxID=2934158 RepID=A0ABY4YWM0_9MICO|nr:MULTISPECIES: hypothetical protein [unclassified Ornithinimicrobium]USQ81051.1 hypothetical protein NF556_05235 [Ornithinimicrobium sp. HY1793]
MYHLIEEQLARSRHEERTANLELEHRQSLTKGLRPTASHQNHRARFLRR